MLEDLLKSVKAKGFVIRISWESALWIKNKFKQLLERLR